MRNIVGKKGRGKRVVGDTSNATKLKVSERGWEESDHHS